jgi:hypothetical protein
MLPRRETLDVSEVNGSLYILELKERSPGVFLKEARKVGEPQYIVLPVPNEEYQYLYEFVVRNLNCGLKDYPITVKDQSHLSLEEWIIFNHNCKDTNNNNNNNNNNKENSDDNDDDDDTNNRFIENTCKTLHTFDMLSKVDHILLKIQTALQQTGFVFLATKNDYKITLNTWFCKEILYCKFSIGK